jgi:serine/threonine protein kinase/WD40 repeat protein
MTTQLHPDSGRLTDYVLGKLPADQVAEVEAHLATCADCQAKAETLDNASDSFVSCLSGAAQETPADPALERLLAGARDLVGATISYQDAAPPKKVVAGLEIRKEIARGGLGVVYLAYHPHLMDFRAVKRPQIRPGVDGGSILARFQREVQAVGKLRHDHVIRAHDAGVDPDGPFLVMEYLDGEPLSRLVKERGPLPVPQACELIRQAALGLQAAHERGLVHRDVKPSNLMLARVNTDAARVVVIDWGLVRQTSDQAGNGVTVVQSVLGTSDYMSPEQHRNPHSVDIRADIYSLGVTFYYLLAGKAPFQGRPDPEKFAAHHGEAFPPLESKRADIPKEVSAILRKMVDKNPAQRFTAPAEVAAALQPYCGSDSRLIDLLERKASPPVATAPRRRPIGLLVAAVAAGAALLLLASVSLGVLMWTLATPPEKKNQGETAAPTTAVLGDGPASPVKMKDSHPGYCGSLVFLADGRRAVSESGGASVYVWDLQTRESQSWTYFTKRPDKGEDVAGIVAASPDGTSLVAAGLNAAPREMYYLELYDQKSLALKKQLFAQFGKMGPAVAFSPGGSELAAVELPGLFGVGTLFADPKIRVIDVPSGANRKQFACAATVRSLAFSPDGKFLAGGDNKTVRVWNWQAAKQEFSIPGHDGAISQVGFSAHGKRLYSASQEDETLRVWNSEHGSNELGSEVKKISIRAAAGKLLATAFWPAGRALTGHADGSVVLWDLDAGKEIKRFTHPGVKITAVAISPDGHHAVAAHSDHSVYLCRLPAPTKAR